MSGISESYTFGVSLQYFSVAAMFLSSTLFYFFLAHILPVSIVGSISLLYAIMNIGATVFMFGFSSGIQHYFSYHLARQNNNTILKLIRKTTLIGLLLASGAFMSLYVLSYNISIVFFHSSIYELSIKIIGVAIASAVMTNVFSSMLLGLNQYKKYALINIFVYTFTYFFPLFLLFIYRTAIYLIIGLAAINTLSASIFVVFVFKYYRKLRNKDGDYEKKPYKGIIHYSIPLFFSSIMGTSATYIDRLVVSYFINLSSLGIYNFALIVAGASSILISPVSALLIPKLSSFFSLDNKNDFTSSIRILLNIISLIYIPAALGIAALSRPILYIFAGVPYEAAYIPLMIIMFVTSIFIGGNILTSGISSIRRTKIFIYSSGFALASNVVLSVILIPRLNIIGAAIAYSSMNAVSFIIVYYFARKFGISNYDIARIMRIWTASIIMFLIVFLIQIYLSYSMLNIIILILLGFLVYIFEIKTFKLISKEEMNYVLSILPNKLGIIKYIMKNLAFQEHTRKNDKLFRFFK
jgi:O-antigen/teichoic acid export membrane protein